MEIISFLNINNDEKLTSPDGVQIDKIVLNPKRNPYGLKTVILIQND